MALFFFFHGDLHKRIHINRPNDTIECYSYGKEQFIKYSFVDVKKNHDKAWTTKEVAQMVNRHPIVLHRAIDAGNIRRPATGYSLTGATKPDAFYWSEQDVMELHDFLLTVHKGRPRKDGRVTPQSMPNARELRAMLRQNLIHYVKTDSGEFVPTWDA